VEEPAEDVSEEAEDGEIGEISVGRFWQAGPELDELHFEIHSPDVPGAVLRLLGPPPAWGSHDDLLTRLHDLYRVASASVRDAALADVDESDDGAPDDER
jgi:hypothetical protein